MIANCGYWMWVVTVIGVAISAASFCVMIFAILPDLDRLNPKNSVNSDIS